MATESVDEILGILADDLINYDQSMTKAGAPNIRFVHKYVKKAKVALDAYYAHECAGKMLEIIGEDERRGGNGRIHQDLRMKRAGRNQLRAELRAKARAFYGITGTEEERTE